MKSYRIRVLQRDIEACRVQRQGDPRRCMISDAVQRAIPEALFIDTDLRYLRFSLESTQRRYFYDLPQVPQRALLDFDNGREVQPFDFRIRRGYSEIRRTKQPGYIPKPARARPTKTRRQAPRRREHGLHAIP
jgi:hypothetical protein